MNYYAWSAEYDAQAEKIREVIERKKKLLKNASKDEYKTISGELIAYRCILRELVETSAHLYQRAQQISARSPHEV